MSGTHIDMQHYLVANPPGYELVLPRPGVKKPTAPSRDYINGICDAARLGFNMRISDEPLKVYYDGGQWDFDCRTNTIYVR